MMRRSPLKQKRDKPRRKAPDRVQHVRTKPKAGSPATAEEKAHIARVAAMPCLICGARPVQVHHVTSDGYKRIARSHKLVTPLCFAHHKVEGGKQSVEWMGAANFHAAFNIDLKAKGERLWKEFQSLL